MEVKKVQLTIVPLGLALIALLMLSVATLSSNSLLEESDSGLLGTTISISPKSDGLLSGISTGTVQSNAGRIVGSVSGSLNEAVQDQPMVAQVESAAASYFPGHAGEPGNTL